MKIYIMTKHKKNLLSQSGEQAWFLLYFEINSVTFTWFYLHIGIAAYRDRDILFILRDECEVRDLQPDIELLSKLDGACIAVTAKGTEYDCVSRVFAPRLGIPEDPVTGSTHCMIVPYWCRRLNKTNITAFQASSRTGTLYCESVGDKVIISGKAVLFSINDIVGIWIDNYNEPPSGGFLFYCLILCI